MSAELPAAIATWAPSVGWAATAVFTASYFARNAETLRFLQMGGATLWLAYGIAIEALPVIVANVLVLGAATYTTMRARGSARRARQAVRSSPSVSPTDTPRP